MAFSKCPHCKGGYFEAVEKEPTNSAYKMNFIQCSGCGAPFGATDYYNVGSLLKKQEQQIAALGQRLTLIESALQQIAHTMRR